MATLKLKTESTFYRVGQTHGSGHTGNMTSFRFLRFLLFLLLLPQVYSEEAELLLRAVGSVIEMGYCFGVDYIVVYRCAPEGDQLLGNSSADSMPITPPADLQGRVRINQNMHLLGLQISSLTHVDSGIYRRECWQNQTLVSHHTQQLSVCDKEIESKEIIVKEEDGGAELHCNSTSIGLEGTSVRWYYEKYPSYRLTLFLDSSVSLHPLVELHGVVKVRDGGGVLLINKNMLKNNQHFNCLVIKGMNCLSFQNMYLPDHSESREIFASRGDKLILNCPFDGNNQQWETPLGRLNGSNMRNNQMYISFGNKSEEYSLVIPAMSDDHSGKYSCISPSSEVEYSLVLCPRKDPTENVFAGGEVSLECDVGQDDAQNVQWYRRETSGEHELIHDSYDENVVVPEDLMDRMTLSGNGSCLTLYDLKMEDGGVYWCVVFGPEFLEAYDEYKDEYDDEEDTEEDKFSNGHYWHDMQRCIFKQEHSVLMKTDRGLDERPPAGPSSKGHTPVTFKPTTNDLENSPTADSLTASNGTVYALVAGIAVLLLAGGIVAVIVVKKRSMASQKQRSAASRSGLNTNNDIKMNVDPGCTERLNPNDGCDA